MPGRPQLGERGSTRKLMASRSTLPSYDDPALEHDDVFGSPTARLSRTSSRGSMLPPRSPSPPPTAARESFLSGTGLTPLDQTLERLGMGRYQVRLLLLCGCGWMADNMWLLCIAVILPRVQEHFAVSDRWIGALSSSIFAGMTLGAWLWGSYSDSFGRTAAFNGTLLLTSFFGLLAGWAPSFGWLCLAMFGLGLGVGGSMPTDGTLFLESIPKAKHYLLTALSFFFSLGSVITSVLGLLIIPAHSCPPPPATCDVEMQNSGWRILLRVLGVLTLGMFIARVFLFRLQESPKWLVSSGRSEDAVLSLQAIAQLNGDARGASFGLADVVDAPRRSEGSDLEYASVPTDEHRPLSPSLPPPHKDVLGEPVKPRYTGRSAALLEQAASYIDRVSVLFRRDMRRTTILVWTIWFTVSASFTLFNVFLPTWLERKLGAGTSEAPKSHTESMFDFVIYTVAGCPGSLIGAWLVETRLGYRYSMASSTFANAVGVLVFAYIATPAAVVISSAWVSLMGTLMYALIYGWTPSAFPVTLRGSACGIASALSRVAGVMAPLLAGALGAISPTLPLILSGLGFFASAFCMLALRPT